ncbi:Rpn family recombination-promoting nuclease/putative transposase [uncultured Fibrella sp.]|uniref:Rpn family recombination-promoting nuclease/putative transposase n=1 Tax=uncultured Fibrella sp. TaxID=1284596 RepID=UPI0035CC1598
MNLYNDNERFISILSDYGFKVTFGNESDTRFLRKALQALIQSPVPIQTIEFIQNEIQGLTKDSRSGIYDLFCTDETGNQFIVEMQLGEYPAFIQRMKFYALYRLNTLIRKGKYQFEGLPRIYCIGILAVSILPQIVDYHNVAVFKNQNNELIDDQMTFITVELDKFKKLLTDVQTDLDKLIYTMKTIDTVTEPTQFPTFWTEEWLETAIRELDTRAMSPEKRLVYEMTIAANAVAINNEQKKIEEAKEAEGLAIRTNAVQNLLALKSLTIEQVANSIGVPVEFVLDIQRQLAKDL